MRASVPDVDQVLDRDGVAIHVEVHGDGPRTLLLVPPSPITDARIWKALLPTLARRHRVVTFDGRGSGGSGRPTSTEEHRRTENVADIVAVLDATGTERAVLVAHCHASWWAVEVASALPHRVAGLVAIAPGVPHLGRSHDHWALASATWEARLDEPQGWQLFNREVITEQHRRWVEFFFGAQLVEPHSTKQHEDAVAWALGSTGEILVASEEAQDLDVPPRAELEAQLRALALPALVIHGQDDVCQHVERGRELAEILRADLVEIVGGGHLPHVRDPVRVLAAIDAFLRRVRRAEGARAPSP